MVRGVLLLGNPLIMWSGVVAIVVCFWDWIQQRRRDAFLILFFYSIFFFSWAVIPRKILFYYYYYPAGMMLSLALAHVFYHRTRKKPFSYPSAKWVFLGAAVCLFVYFFPILSAMKIPADSFRRWMWFVSWI
jgi:dolichyl-phosphate-mannose--protein O-mannosyl transferase